MAVLWGDEVMYNQITIKLNKNYQRPVIELPELYGISALLDTGASFPVWTGSKETLINLKAILVKENVKFGGFGQGDAIGDIYKIPLIKIRSLIYPWLHIVHTPKDYPYKFIISATMFQNLIYQVDDKNKRLNIDIPDGESNIKNLVLKYNDNRIKVLVTDGEANIS